MLDVEIQIFWTSQELSKIEDVLLQERLEGWNLILDIHWDIFEHVLIKNQEIFGEKLRSKQLFLNVFKKVCTRVIAHGNLGTVMVPMADNFNHSC